MKAFFQKLVPAIFVLAIFSVPANAAEEKYETFARENLPNIQKINRDFRRERQKIIDLRREIVAEIRADFPEIIETTPGGIDGLLICKIWALKIKMLEAREAEWAKFLKEVYVQHKTGFLDAETLDKYDRKMTKEAQKWKREQLDKVEEKFWSF